MVQIQEVLVVALGGAIGAMLRFLTGRGCEFAFPSSAFPVATLLVNIVGCFLIGLISGFSLRGELASGMRLFLVTGILGGFTTFSAFGLEAVALMRSGHTTLATSYVLGSVIGGGLAVMAGISLSAQTDTIS